MNDSLLPKESRSQSIGQLAVSALRNAMPVSWRERDLSGDDDVGFDMRIQLVADGRYTYDFFCQIKGTTQVALSKDGQYYSVPLKVATLSYMKKTGNRTMLVLADLSSTSDPRSCRVVHAWIHDEIPEKLAELPEDVAADSEVTFRIPATSLLVPDTDVLPYLREDERRRNALESLNRAISSHGSAASSVELVTQISANIREKGSLFLESTASGTETALADAAYGSNAWLVRQAMNALTSNNADRALEILSDVDTNSLSDDRARSEVHFICGRAWNIRGDSEAAAREFRKARELSPAVDAYRAAELEVAIRTDFSPLALDKKLLEISAALHGHSPEQRPKLAVLQARALIALNRLQEGEDLLLRIPLRESAVERGILAHIRGDTKLLRELIQESEATNLSANGVLTLRILEYRTYFAAAVGATPDDIVPALGSANTNPNLIADLWTSGQSLAKDLQRSGWAPNSDLFLDAFCSVAIIVGAPGVALSYVADFLDLRPVHSELQSVRMKVAVYANNREEAFAAVAKIPDEQERAVNEVLVRYDFEDFPGVIQRAEELLKVPLTVDHACDAHIMCALCARFLLNSEVEKRCLDRLRREPEFADHLTVYDLVSCRSEGGVVGDDAARRFRKKYEERPESALLQDHAVHNLDRCDASDREFVAALEASILARRQLSIREIVSFVRYYKAHSYLDNARKVLGRARLLRPKDIQLKSLDAALSEAEGHAARAMALAREVAEESSENIESALGIYSNIAMRCGLVDEARTQLRAMLANVRETPERLEVLRILFALELASGGDTKVLVQLSTEYGRLADRSDEVEEGIYVQQMLMAGLRTDIALDQRQREELNQRAEAYFQKFPDSKTISRFQVDENATGEELLELMRQHSGITRESLEEYALRARQLETGKLVVPYAWRPRTFLLNVGSVAHLWELTKVTRYGPEAHKLMVYRHFNDVRELSNDGRIPLIDYSTLLVVTELDLWLTVFRMFPIVAITKRTLHELQQDAGMMGFSTEVGRRLRAVIASNVERILQPGVLTPNGERVRDGGLKEIKDLMSVGRYVLYSDDLLARLYVLGDEQVGAGITSIDVIEAAKKRKLMTVPDAARLYARVYRWNMDPIPIYKTDFLAVVPRDLGGSGRLSLKIEALFQDRDFRAFADVSWDHKKNLEEIVKHAAGILAAMVNGKVCELDSNVVAAVWAQWFDKVALRTDKSDPMDALSMCLCLAIVDLREAKRTSWVLWSAFRMLVERRYGDRMDKSRENKEVARVGKNLAIIVTANPLMQARADDMLLIFRQGLGVDTEPDGVFTAAYEESRVALENEKDNKDS